MPPTEVFLSHSSHDNDMAKKLADVVTRHGIPVFYGPEKIAGGRQWQDEVLAALQRCDWFAVLLSADAVASRWVRREVAFVLDQPRFDNKIIPLNYRPCDLKTFGWLSAIQMVDFSADFAEGCRKLLQTWGIGARDELLA